MIQNIEALQAALLAHAKEYVEKILREGGEVMPVVLTPCQVNDNQLQVVAGLAYMGERKKSKLFFQTLAEQVELFVIVNEIWRSSYTMEQIEAAQGTENLPPPHEDPNRTEAVAVTLVYGGKTIHQDFLPFKRKNGQCTFGQWEHIDNCQITKESVFPAQE